MNFRTLSVGLKALFRGERSNRPAAANRAEETHVFAIVARWNAVPLKTDVAMVHIARV